MAAEPMAILRTAVGAAIPLKGVRLNGAAEGCLFDLAVEQRYHNAEAEAIEAIYTFPLPLGAVLLSFELEIGERRMRGIVQKKVAATQNYEESLEGGDTAALLARARDGLYTVSLGNLRAGEEAVIRFRYAELLELDEGRLRLAIPLAIAPRYGNPAGALEVHQAPSTAIGANYPCELTLTLRGDLARAKAHSPTHALVASAGASELTLTSRPGLVLDRDLVVLVEGLPANSLAVVGRDGDGYVSIAAMTVPPLPTQPRGPRSLKLLVDCSGSMAGDSIDQARGALLRILGTLTPTDRISLTLFGSTRERLTDGLDPATPALLAALTHRVRKLQATLGGTEMLAALGEVARLPAPAGTIVDLLLITDGEIWQIDPLVGALDLVLANHRLFVLAVGSTPSEELAKKVAAKTGGACEFVTPGEDMTAAVGRLMRRMGSPPRHVEAVEWPAALGWSIGVGKVVFDSGTVHLFCGSADMPSGALNVRFDLDGGETSVRCELPATLCEGDTLARVAAHHRLDEVEPDPAAALAEHYQLVTGQTSCVVQFERGSGEKASDMPALRAVPQMLAAGWSGTGTMFGSAHRPDAGSVHFRGLGPSFLRTVQPADSLQMSRSSLSQPPAGARIVNPAPGHVAVGQHESAHGIRRIEWTPLSRLVQRIMGGEQLRPSINDLRLLGVPDSVLERLLAFVAEGHDERDVVIAWLAVFVWSREGTAMARDLKAQIARAADSSLRARISVSVPEFHAP